MKRTAYSMFRNSKDVFQKGTKLNLKQHYRTLICNEEGKFQPTDDMQKYTFPKDLGFLMHLTQDRKETETRDEYLDRCYKQVMDIINTYGEDNFVFFAYSTVFHSRISKAIDTQSIKAIEQKFLDSKNITSFDLAVTAGHIAVYTRKGKYLSHSSRYDQSKSLQVSQSEIVRYDVAKSIAEKQQVSTYIVVISKSCFPKVTFEDLSHIIKRYGWAAKGELEQKDEEDNCATAMQKIFTDSKIRKIMNPIQTLYFVIRAAMYNMHLTENEINDTMNIMLDSKLERDLEEIALHEEEYKGGFTITGKNLNLSKNIF